MRESQDGLQLVTKESVLQMYGGETVILEMSRICD